MVFIAQNSKVRKPTVLTQNCPCINITMIKIVNNEFQSNENAVKYGTGFLEKSHKNIQNIKSKK
jgi:hypothetical protein